jgi:regulatory protein
VALDPPELERAAQAAYAKAVELLGRRTHFRAEVASKLERRGFPPAAVAEALDRLVERGYLDDREAAREWMAGALRRGRGPRRLRSELAARGVGAEIVGEVVSGLSGEAERELARQAAARFRGRGAAALARHLDRRGFSKAVILEIVRGLGPGAGDPDREP